MIFRPISKKIFFVIFMIFTFIPFSLSYGEQGLEGYWVPLDPPRCHYRIDARIDLEKGVVEGRETIDLKNTARRPIYITAFKSPFGSNPVITVTIAGKELPALEANCDPGKNSQVYYRLPKPLAPGEKTRFTVDFQYTFKMPANDPEWGSTGWYPRLWWNGMPVHDSFSVTVETPKEYALAASGRLNPATGRFECDSAKTFGIYLGKNLKTKSREVEGILITTLFTQKGAQCASVCLETAADCIAFYKHWLGFYPFKFLYIIPGGPGRWGGYPFATGIVVIHGQETFKPEEPRLWWQWITAHEIGHEYWGEWVMNPDNPAWLWIGMGIFADTEYLTVKKIDPDRRSKWMGNYLYGLSRYYDTTVDMPAVCLSQVKYDDNNIVVHSKGFSIISALDAVLGREIFEKIYKKCLRHYGGKRLRWRELQRICEEDTNQNLDWFFQQWVRTNAYLCYRVESQESLPQGNGFLSIVKVKQLGTMKMPVPVKACFTNGSVQLQFTPRCQEISTLKFYSKAKLKEVILDPEKKLAMLEEPLTELPAEIAQLFALGWNEDDSLQIYEKIKDEEITDWRIWNRLGYYLFYKDEYAAAIYCYKKVLELPVAENVKAEVNYKVPAFLGALADLQGNRSEALSYYQQALKNDTSQTLKYKRLAINLNRQWVEERLKTPFTLQTPVEIPAAPTAQQLSEILQQLGLKNEGQTPKLIYEKAGELEIDHPDFWMRLGFLLFDSGYYEEAFSSFTKLFLLGVDDKEKITALTWMGHLKDLLSKREEALQYYNKALELENHTGISIHHNPFGLKTDRRWIEKRIKTPFTWKKERGQVKSNSL